MSNMGCPILDPFIGLIIGFLILKTAYEIGKTNLDNIMGKVPSQEFIDKIKEIANDTTNKYFKTAIEINPNNKRLIDNLEIMKKYL